MTTLLLLAACTSDHFSIPLDGPVGASAEGPALVKPAPVTPHPRETASAGSHLIVSLAGEPDGFVELRPYRADEDGVTWVGVALDTLAVTGDQVNFSLPVEAPKRDRLARDADVRYAVALRAADADGEPGVYTGVASVDLAYTPDDDAWSLVSGYGTADETWKEVSDGVTVSEDLAGASSLSLAGSAAYPIAPGTHIAVATDEDAVSVFDAPIGSDWSISLDFAARLVDAGHADGALLRVAAYVDDGDNTWNGEETAATACAGVDDVYVSWFAWPYDLGDAIALHDLGVPAGWGISLETPDGLLLPIPTDMQSSLQLRESCDAGPGPAPDEGDP